MMDIAQLQGVLARRELSRFAMWVMPDIEFTPFHKAYYNVLDAFAHGKIRRLIVNVPPQHGKSLGSSQLLPAFILGLNPDAKICIGSYAFSLAAKFSRRVQRLMADPKYRELFPDSPLKECVANSGNYIQTAEEFEVVGRVGGLRAAGREGSITGNTVDIMILDDIYKDAMEANSPLVRDNTWEFYTSVVRTRLHNNSQELIVLTRWHEDDIIGRLKNAEKVIELSAMNQISQRDGDSWYLLNFEAIKESNPTMIDPRGQDEALWPSRHDIASLMAKRNLDRQQFDCMYQGNPSTKEGLLYGDKFKMYDTLPTNIVKRGAYIDTADGGSDNLCAIAYVVANDGRVCVVDVVYTAEPMEVTENAVSAMLARNDVRIAYVESNSGGRGFARVVGRAVPACKVEWFYQSANKESRILTSAPTVIDKIILPADWRIRWPQFYGDLITFKRNFRANKHDDAADALTGVAEKEVLAKSKISVFHFTK